MITKMINIKQLFSIILGTFLLTGCFSEDESTTSNYNMQNLPPLKVSTYEVKLQDIPISLVQIIFLFAPILL